MLEGIRVENLRKHFKNKVAVDRLNFTIPQGELFALLGMNGAGKTTTIRILCGLIEPDDGDAFLHGFSIRKQKEEAKRLLGVSPQATAVAANLTVRENLELMAALYMTNKEQRKMVLQECIERFSLRSVENQRAKTLSGGFQRRLSIAMALIGQLEIVFLDEPTLGLDVVARHELWDLLREMKGKTTIVLTTHYLEEAEALADRIGIMARGKLCAMGTVQELCEKTACSSFEEAFLSCVKEKKDENDSVRTEKC